MRPDRADPLLHLLNLLSLLTGASCASFENCGPVSGRRRPVRPLGGPTREKIMTYVDGFLLAVPKARLEEYNELARKGKEVWMEHGALSYVETKGDDVPYGELTSFPRAVQAKDDEIVIFSWITYESREARDRINKLVMEDPRMQGDMEKMPFDGKRMIFGGFEAFVEA
jgi:uncharacterized protein YbaA (DUF1428 family)